MSLVAILLAVLLAIPSLYLGVLGLLALLPRGRGSHAAARARRFGIVVPAHNEAARIGALLDSLADQSYPSGQIRIIVVADNCTDDTAKVARARGVEVVERQDAVRRGKGFALDAGLRHLQSDAEAVLFIDGDCTVSNNALSVLNADIEGGAHAIQCRYVMAVDENSASSGARRLALALVHIVRPLAKERLRASAGLKGSGMCFERTFIDALGWNVHGLAEDIEQHLALLRLGERVRYEHDVVVTGDSPARLSDAASQHERWEAGRMSASLSGPRLLAQGLRRRSVPMIDAAFELLLPPLSVLGVGLVIVTVLTGLRGGDSARLLVGVSWCALACYGISGIARAGLRAREIAQMIVTVPVYGAWKVLLYGRAIIKRPDQWEPTRRDER